MAEAHAATDAAAACSTEFFSARIESLREALSKVNVNDDEARVEAEIKASKVHWSELTSAYGTVGEVLVMESSAILASELSSLELERTSEVERMREWNERVAEDNVEVFRSLQARYPGGFFVDNNNVGPDHLHKLPLFLIDGDGKPLQGEVEISSEKPFAEGAQAQLFHAHAVFLDGKRREGLVMKVFKEGTPLRDLQMLLPPSMLKDKDTQNQGWFRPNLCNIIMGARLLKSNGRFAFLMGRAWGDLQKLINVRMLHGNNNQGAPFSDGLALWCMLCIAKGMQSLHAKGIVHRDLKAANVLINTDDWMLEFDPILLKPCTFSCQVADFECSGGVVGTRFWRAPEILLAVKNRNYHENLEIFSKQADVYSFGMTCYEILTGRIPFEELRENDYDEVIGGARPILPKQTPLWIAHMVTRCWDKDSYMRPSFDEILREFNDHRELM